MRTTPKRISFVFLILILFFFISACAIFSIAPAATPTPSATFGPTNTPTITPTSTQTPTPTPLPDGAITASSCAKMTQTNSLGEGQVKGMVFSPDSSTLLIWSDSGISAYDLVKNERLWKQDNLLIESAGINERRGVAVAITTDNTLTSLDLASGTIYKKFPAQGDFMKGFVSEDGMYIGILDWIGGITIFDRETLEMKHSIEPLEDMTFGDTFFTTSLFTPDSKYLITGALGGEIKIYQVSNGTQAYKIGRIWENEDYDTRQVPNNLVVSKNGKTLAIGYSNWGNDSIMVTNIANPKINDRIPGWNPALSPDGKVLAYQNDNELRVIQVDNNQVLASLAIQPYGVYQFSPDGNTFAVATAQGLDLIDTSSWKNRATLEGFYSRYEVMAQSPDGKTIAALENQAWLSLIDTDGGKIVKKQLPESVDRVAFSSDGKKVLLYGLGNFLVWDMENSQSVLTTILEEPAELTTISPNGEIIAYVNSKEELIIKEPDREAINIKAPAEKIAALSFSPASDRLYAALAGGDLVYWSANDDYQKSTTLESDKKKVTTPLEIAFFQNGQQIAIIGYSGGKSLVASWDIQGGQPYPTLLSIESISDQIEEPRVIFAMSPFGNVLFSDGTGFESPRLLFPKPNAPNCKLEDMPFTTPVQGFFSPDGTSLIVLDENGTIYIMKNK